MSFTPIGVFIMIIGLISFIYSTKRLFGLCVFFIPFSGTAVINIGADKNGISIQPYMFLGSLFIIKVFIESMNSGSRLKNPFESLPKSKLLFGCFVITAIISIIMPIIIDGQIVGNTYGYYSDYEPIHYSSRNITQVAYFLLGAAFSYVVGYYASKMGYLVWGIKIFSYSIMFIIFWGAIEFLCHKLSIPYPVSVFNNSANATLVKETKFLDLAGGISRISSVTAEASILAQQLVAYLPFLLAGLEKKVYIFSKTKDLILCAVVIIFVFMTTSSSGIVCTGLLIFIFIITNRSIFTKKGVIKLTLQTIAVILCLPIVYLIIPNIIESALFNKADSWSAIERLSTITSGWKNFTQYPLLGVGWGTITVNDFLIKILSNTGIIGFAFFASSMYYVIKQHVLISKKFAEDNQYDYLNRACILSLIILLFNCEIAGFSFYFGIFWLILGFCMVNKRKLTYILK